MILRVLEAALDAADPYQAICRHLVVHGDQLHIGSSTYPLRRLGRIWVVGAGKAVVPMAEAVVDRLGERVSGGLLIVKDGYGDEEVIGPVQVRPASHPVPDDRGLAATAEMLALLSRTQPEDLVIALISGGGSALLSAPAPGVPLSDLQSLTAALLRSGAEIGEINAVRVWLDEVKGGGLVRAAAPAAVAGLVLSDVIGDPLEWIASGPTVLSTVPRPDAVEILARYSLDEGLPDGIRTALRRPPPPFAPTVVDNLLIGNNRMAGEGALAAARHLGITAEWLPEPLQGEARLAGERYGRLLRGYAESGAERPHLWLAGGETTVTVTGDGIGGRNQELALAAVPLLDGVEGAVLVSLATDGGDGPTEAAGAVVTGETLARAADLGLDPADHLTRNDSHPFFAALGDCLMTEPTRTNLNDLLLLWLV
jgi:hydroxypyruvate reductase